MKLSVRCNLPLQRETLARRLQARVCVYYSAYYTTCVCVSRTKPWCITNKQLTHSRASSVCVPEFTVSSAPLLSVGVGYYIQHTFLCMYFCGALCLFTYIIRSINTMFGRRRRRYPSLVLLLLFVTALLSTLCLKSTEAKGLSWEKALEASMRRHRRDAHVIKCKSSNTGKSQRNSYAIDFFRIYLRLFALIKFVLLRPKYLLRSCPKTNFNTFTMELFK